MTEPKEAKVPLAWLLLACRTGADVRQGPVVDCPDPDRRDSRAFDQPPSQTQTRLDRADLHGGGLLVEDLDDDGWLDLFIPGESEHVLRWGRQGGPQQFEVDDDALAALPVDFAVGATAVDADGDGDLDVYVTRWEQPNTLLRNDGNRRFVDITAEAFPGSEGAKSQSASWGDIDRDGDLDLFVGTYGAPTVINVLDPKPDCSDHDPDRAQLWRNEGDGTFTDISDELPPIAHGYTFMSGFYDLDDDQYPELILAHDDGLCGPSALLRNVRGTFVPDPDAGLDRGAHDMGMGVADLNGDALPDFLLTSWNSASYLQSREGPQGVQWVDFSDALGLVVDGAPTDRPAQAQDGQQIYGWGAEFGDLDNDADLDGLMLFGYWSYYRNAGNKVLQRDGLWIQDASGQFSDEGEAWGLAESHVSRGAVLADLTNDGYLDVIKHFLDEGIALHLSRCGDAAWTRIRLEGPKPNTRGVGARITVEAGGKTQVRWIQSGSSGMYTGAPLEAHLGLGDAAMIDRIEVVWPDGVVTQSHQVEPRRQLTIRR